eukprot:CAMPEP_0195513558 /NCGR_PEP_ID=MMETSP0794_2-20130614/5192_1 /TAXON_ID=515487 /ORGANISM="Stephanopyxis turris, Strain CCMP 815" /LENGTH=58 /DNA_ID=CAMNT_0040641605 /DNA_START=156 /DNA_END=333 /DNA_ORIENTATION=+
MTLTQAPPVEVVQLMVPNDIDGWAGGAVQMAKRRLQSRFGLTQLLVCAIDDVAKLRNK